MGTLAITTLKDRVSGDNTPALDAIHGSAKAWVNFNGTGTVAIRASYNVSSITDNGTGDYTLNLTNALTDGDFAISGFAIFSTASTAAFVSGNSSYSGTSTTVPIQVAQTNTASRIDSAQVHVAVFR